MSVLDLPMEDNDANAKTIREFLKALLATVWTEGEGFSGKRPFGNSGWEWDVYKALVQGGALAGEFDEDGHLEDLDREGADHLILKAIAEL